MVATTEGKSPQTFGVLGGTAIKPPERHGWEAVRYLLYNPENGEVFTRTPKSWALIFIFYCIYYTCLAGFWYGMMQVFLLTVPMEHPKWILDNGIIGTNPGLGMQPRQMDKKIDSSMFKLIWNATGETATEDGESELTIDWAQRMKIFLSTYENKTGTSECNNGASEGSLPCRFKLDTLGPCGKFPYGYQKEASGQVEPCVVFKVNRIYAWDPVPLTNEDLDNEALAEMPKDLKDKIRANPGDRDNLFISCEGEWPVDRDSLGKNIEYYPPNQGIPFKYFPYVFSGQNYHSPLVAVKLKNLPVGQLVHIECRLWGKYQGNKFIAYNRKDRIGMARFEVILDNNTE